MDESHRPVSASEEQFVRMDFGSFGRPDALLVGMPDVPVKKRQRVDSVAEVVKELVDERNTATTTLDSATLRDIREERGKRVGVFDMSFSTTWPAGKGASKTIDAHGAIEIRADDCRLLSLSASGDMTMTGATKGTGTVSYSTEWTYSE
jgi:hypothetical protein